MALGHLLAERHDDGASGTGYGTSLALEQANWVEGECTESVDDVAAEETSGTEDGSGMALVGVSRDETIVTMVAHRTNLRARI